MFAIAYNLFSSFFLIFLIFKMTILGRVNLWGIAFGRFIYLFIYLFIHSLFWRDLEINVNRNDANLYMFLGGVSVIYIF